MELTKEECERYLKGSTLNEYSIAYSMQKGGMAFETRIVAKSKKDALHKLYKQLGTDFYYDEVILGIKHKKGETGECTNE